MNPIVGKIDSLKRLNSSSFGNPNWAITIDTGEGIIRTRTKLNASISYAIDNPEYQDTALKFSFTKAGRVSSIDFIKDNTKGMV